ncbi:MAG: hypothetical protein OK457_00080 [Thaumarchaeota archaeon]|nr:hypothetical protein [Nitrososphaerota archaeon]
MRKGYALRDYSLVPFDVNARFVKCSLRDNRRDRSKKNVQPTVLFGNKGQFGFRKYQDPAQIVVSSRETTSNMEKTGLKNNLGSNKCFFGFGDGVHRTLRSLYTI